MARNKNSCQNACAVYLIMGGIVGVIMMGPYMLMYTLPLVLVVVVIIIAAVRKKRNQSGSGGRIYRTGASQTSARSAFGSQYSQPSTATTQPTRKSESEVVSYIKRLPSIYKEIQLGDLANTTGWNKGEIRSLVENMMFRGELKVQIQGDNLMFDKESSKPAPAASTPAPSPVASPPSGGSSIEAQVYNIARDTGNLDLNLISSHLGITNDNVIMVLYRMMEDFDGDVDGDKFKLFGNVKQDSIHKLFKKLEEKFK